MSDNTDKIMAEHIKTKVVELNAAIGAAESFGLTVNLYAMTTRRPGDPIGDRVSVTVSRKL